MRYSILRALPSPILDLGPIVGGILLLAMLLTGSAFGAGAKPPTHPLDGYKDCLQCHGQGKTAIVVPASHSSFTTEVCVSCHEPAPNASGTPPAGNATGQAAVAASGDAICLSCHNNQNLTIKLTSGETLPLYIDDSHFRDSVHGSRLGCTDCHSSMAGTAYPHPKVRYGSRRDYATTYYEACKRCHFPNYTKTLDSVHFAALSAGRHDAPVCSDCHGSHYITPARGLHTVASEACGKCHVDVANDYSTSVHGQAQVANGNADVPVCTTCHGVHSIQSATSASFRLASAQLCAQCHADSQLMTKYGLSADVLKTYFEDFHGRTVGFYQQQSTDVNPSEPLCIDCHGIHNIKAANDPNSPVIKVNLQATCQKCHTDASPNFPTAWLGHYEPSPEKASLVYYIRLYYWILIPMMIGGLILHIGLDLWRLARNR